MELYKYDFAYIFMKSHNRTGYIVTDLPVDGNCVIEYGTEAAIKAGVELIEPMSCITEKSPTGVKVYVAEPNLTVKSSYLPKTDINIIYKQTLTCLQAIQKRYNYVTDIVINIDGKVCLEPVSHVIQLVLHDFSCVFRSVVICCPNAEVKSLYTSAFNIMNRL
jgi:hypothetical protein